MRVLCCLSCNSIFNLQVGITKTCKCGNVSGKYVDELNAEFTANNDRYCLIGLANDSLVSAIEHVINHRSQRIPLPSGTNFNAFVIPEPCKTFKRVSILDDD